MASSEPKLPPNLKAEKSVVLINKRQVQAMQWLQYIKKHWYELTADLYDGTILILAGRHGLEDGRIGPKQDIVLENHRRFVSV